MPTMDEATTSMIRNLESQSGRSMADWVALVRCWGLDKHKAMVDRLKAEQGIGHGYANLVAHMAAQGDTPPADDDLVAAQYAGAKAPLRALYEQLLALIGGFGPDLEISPKKTYVSLRRSRQFALIQPSTATRLDVGLNLKGVEPDGRLEASGNFNAMCTHRVRVSGPDDLDELLTGWLRQAYEKA